MLFPNENPIGRRISFEARRKEGDGVQVWREIVGLVRHVRHYGLTQGPPYVQVYTPFAQLAVWFENRHPTMVLAVRTAIAPESLTGSIRRELAAIDSDIPVYNVQTMTDDLTQHTEQPCLNMILLGALGGLALMLATIGVYGVISYSVARRRYHRSRGRLAILGLLAGVIPARRATRVDPLEAMRQA
jgi:ABC-type antimicrobial peptide transport system permease subunit